MKKSVFVLLGVLLAATVSQAKTLEMCFEFRVVKAGQVTNTATCNVQQEFLSGNSAFWRCSFDGKVGATVTSAIETGYDESTRQPYMLYQIRPSARVGLGKFLFEGMNFPKSDVTVPFKIWLTGAPYSEFKKFESEHGVIAQTLELVRSRFGYCTFKK